MFTSHTFALILSFPLIWVYQTLSLLLAWLNHIFFKLSFIFSRLSLILYMLFVIILGVLCQACLTLPCHVPLSFALVSRCYAHLTEPQLKWFSIGRLWKSHLVQFKQRLDAVPVVVDVRLHQRRATKVVWDVGVDAGDLQQLLDHLRLACHAGEVEGGVVVDRLHVDVDVGLLQEEGDHLCVAKLDGPLQGSGLEVAEGVLGAEGVATGPTLPNSVHIFTSLQSCFCCFQVASLTVEI